MRRLAPQRRLLGEATEVRMRRARVSTTTEGFAEEVEALFLIAAGVGSVVVRVEGTRQAVLLFDPSSEVELDADGSHGTSREGTRHSGITFASRSAREFAEGATAALRELRAIDRDEAPRG